VPAESTLQDDGLEAPEIGPWGEHKYRLAQGYARVFATAMKRKWDQRVYVDLYAGSGRARIEGTTRIVPTSPLRALKIPDPFDQYVFCELNPKLLEALRTRVSREHKDANVSFVLGNVNTEISEVLMRLPIPSRTNRVLTFCFADPYKLDDLKFETVQQLSQRYVDFLILVPTEMDANRNERRYIQPENKTLDEFFGDADWRVSWGRAKREGEPFWGFVLKHFASKMEALEYLDQAAQQAELIRSFEKNLPLYRLAFFSRNELGTRFWKEVRKYATPQTAFDF
jgi:three-Cys-motif partner protein